MARLLRTISMQHLLGLKKIPITFYLMVISAFAMLSILSFLCASHKTKNKIKKKEAATITMGDSSPKKVAYLSSTISSKALLMVKMISWKRTRVDDEDQEKDDDDEAVWQKAIIKGERCRPLDFSGKIEYDSHGNLLLSSPHEQLQI